MLRSLVLGALVGAAAAKDPTVDLARSYNSNTQTTVFTYTVESDDPQTLFSVPIPGCDIASNTGGFEATSDSVSFTGGSGTYAFVLNGNVPQGQTQVTGIAGGDFQVIADGPNCAESDVAPGCDFDVQSFDTVACSNGAATISLSTSVSAASYAWSAGAGTFSAEDTSSTTLTIPVDECTESTPVTLTTTSAAGTSSTCQGTARYAYAAHLAFSSAPDNLRINVADGVPAAATPQAIGSDSCFDATISYTESKESTDSVSTYVLTRTWVLTDDCSGDTQITQKIEVFDSDPPVLSGIPADQTVSCDNVPPPCEATAFDDADNVGTLVSFTETRDDGSCPSEYTLFRAWASTDTSGNTVTAHQTIAVVDNSNPVLIGVPSDFNAECNAVPGAATVTGHDNCDRSVQVSLVEDEILTGLVRTWTVSDLCGNTNSDVQTITIGDSVPPTLTGVEADKTVECHVVPSSPCEVTAKDTCDGSVVVSHSQQILPGSCDDEYSIVNTWDAEDASSNPVSDTQTIVVQDTTPPEIHGMLTNNMPVSCNRTIPDTSSAYDLCDDAVDLQSSDEMINSADTHNYNLVRTYTATDSCGNTASASSTVVFTDTVEPALDNTPMPEITVQCSAVPEDNVVTATDNCDGVRTVSYTAETVAGSCLNKYTLIRTWSASDTSNNPAEFVQTINVIDTDEPEMQDAPPGFTVECDSVPDRGQIGDHDTCGDTTFDETTETLAGSCTHTYDLVHTWSSVDNCGNTNVRVQTVEVSDNTPPSLRNVPMHDAAECNAVPDAANVRAMDNCANVYSSVEYTEVTVPGTCEFTYTLLRSWDVTDDCGLTDSATQTITITDTQVPEVVACVSGYQGALELYDELPVNSAADYSSTDTCDTVTTDYTEDLNDADHCSQILTRTWTTTDDCGNTSPSCVHTWSITDTTPPTITSPEDVNVECDFPAAGPASVEDYVTENSLVANYTGNTVSHNGPTCEKTVDSCTHSAVYVCTYVATDRCSLTATDTTTIVISDNNAPVFDSIIADETKECEEVNSAAFYVTATDQCDGHGIEAVYTSDVLESDNQTVIEKRVDTWTATDSCGNQVEQWRTLLIQDTTKPTVTCPAPQDVECYTARPSASDLAVVSYDDSCKIRDRTATITQENNFVGDSCDGDYNRTYTVTDAAGNTESCSFDWFIEDASPPSCTAPQDTTVECTVNNALSYPVEMLAGCGDNCALSPDQDFTQSIVYYEECDKGAVGSIYRSWVVSDDCGNDQPYVQTIVIEDTTDPVLHATPADVQIDCSYTEPPAAVYATDDCDAVTTVFASSMTDAEIAAACAPFSWTRTWTATDECGNTAVHVQTIDITGNVNLAWDAPFLPLDVFTVLQEWSAYPDTSRFTSFIIAKSTCASEAATCSFTKVDGSCPQTYDLINTCSVTSRCDTDGLTFSQTIQIQDTTPIAVSAGPDQELDCATVADGLSSETNCEDSDCATPGNCAYCYMVTRTCSTVDDCGNRASDDRVITVVDSEDPVITAPVDYTADCASGTYPMDDTNATVTDNCDVDITVTEGDSTETPDSLGNKLRITKYRHFTSTDSCGNDAQAVQTIRFYDTTPPSICDPYDDMTAEHTNVPTYSASFPRPTDNQMGDGTRGTATCPVTIEEDDCSTTELQCNRHTVEGSCPQNYDHVYTWVNIDAEENQAWHSYTVTIFDTTPPVFNPASIADVTVSVNSIPAINVVTASDASGSSTTITYTETRQDGDNVNEFTLVREWSVVDECGNTKVMDYTLTVEDAVDPVIEGTVDSETIQCDESPTHIAADVTIQILHWADEGTEITPREEKIPGTCDNEYKVVYHYLATDVADNTAQDSYTITVIDTVNPTWTSELPQDDLVEGCTTTPAPDVTATDTCAVALQDEKDDAFHHASGSMWGIADVQVVLTEETVPVGTGGDYDVQRLWVATDACGNFIDHTQTVQHRDTTAPTFDNNSALAAAVDKDVNDTCVTPEPEPLTCTDACYECTVERETTYADPTSCAQPSTIYTYTTTDTEGNEAYHLYTVTYYDNEKPTFTPFLPSVATITIDMCQVDPEPPVPVAADDCDDPDVGSDDISITGPVKNITNGEQQYTLTWTVTDKCGNLDTITQIINRVDELAPGLTIPEDVTFTCDETVTQADASAFDDCDGDTMSIDETAVTVTSECGSEYMIIRTFSVTDGYNPVTAVQTITIVDDGAPDLQAAPADITHTDICDVPEPAELTWSDCGHTYGQHPEGFGGTAQVTTSEEILVTGSCHSKVHTWTATDGCGNVSGAKQTVTIDDITPPVIENECAGDTFQCEAIKPPCPEVYATDNCDAAGTVVVVQTNRTEPGDCDGRYSFIRTFSATDSCGNNATDLYQTIALYDDSAPEFNMIPPETTTFDCATWDSVADTPVLTASDNCDVSVDVTHTATQVIDSSADYRFDETYIHTWSTVDSCGNSNTTTQTVTIEDTTDPTFNDVPDANMTCNDHDYRIPDPVIADDCCDPTLHRTMEVISTCPTVHAYIFTAVDCAGNTKTDTATITFIDDTPPTFHHIHDFATVYNNDTSVPDCVEQPLIQPTATDDCDDTITVNAAVVTDLPNQRLQGTGKLFRSKLRTWTVQDGCGNEQTAIQTSYIDDREDPVLSCTSCDDKTIQDCDAIVPQPQVTGLDNCLSDMTMTPDTYLHFDETVQTEVYNCYREHIFTYTINDDNGNTDSGTNTVTVHDTVAPVLLNVPADETNSCQSAATHAYPSVTAEECHVTSDPIYPTTVTLPGSCPDTYKVVATWTNTDACGNSVTDSQTVDFVDDEAPTLSYTDTTITAECDDVPPIQTTSASDACDNSVDTVPTTDIEDEKDRTCLGNYTIVHSWVATDNCGRTDSGARTVVVEDTTPPVMNTICADDTIECKTTVPTCPRTATDACDTEVSAVDQTEKTLPGSCPWTYEIERTFYVVDDCGNEVTDSQTITVQDTTDPEISGPADVVAEVPKIPFAYEGDHTYDDNCATLDIGDLACTERKVDGSCDHKYDLVRQCVVTDDCGLTAEHTYTVDVQDTTPPVLTGVPDDITVEYDSVPAAADALALVRATDNSDSTLTEAVTENEINRTNAHEYTLVREFSVEDNCGNSVVETQTIVVEDTCPPTLNEEPADETVDCDAIPTPCVLSAVGEPDLTVDFTTSELADPKRILRSWTVTDEADNTAAHVQTLTVVDNAAPILSRTPEDVTVDCSCEDFPAAPTVIALDNCDPSVTVDSTESRVSTDSVDEYTLVRSWTATDTAGNVVSHTQSIVVEDTESPVIFPVPPATVDATCATVPAIATVSVLDNCDTDASYSTTEETLPGSCPHEYTIVRTWNATDRTGNTDSWTQTVGVTDTAAPVGDVLEDGCVMQGGVGSVSYTFEELFSAQEECSSVTFSVVWCNVTGLTCTTDVSGFTITGDFDGKAESGALPVLLSVDATDDCGNTVNLNSNVFVHSEMTAATAGAEDCKVVPADDGGKE